jgi:NADH:ubiquinone oxidoreductase subunit E
MSETAPGRRQFPTRLFVCVGPRCDAEGRAAAQLAALRPAVEAAFAQELADGRLRFDTRECLRLCTRDPVVRIDPEGEPYSGASVDEIWTHLRASLAAG